MAVILRNVQSVPECITGLSRKYTERTSQGGLVVVQSHGTDGEAEVAKGVLESSGIDAMIQSDTLVA